MNIPEGGESEDRFGPNLTELRTKRKIKQVELSAKTGVGCSMISEIETGKKRATLAVAIKLAEALGTTVSDLLRVRHPSEF